MSNLTIAPNEFAESINKLLDEYGDEVSEKAAATAKKVATKGKKMVKQNGLSHWIGYNSGWAVKTESDRLTFKAVIHNKKYYRLTHLLEFGHAKVNGGRTRSFPHIGPVNDWVHEEYLKELEAQLYEIK